MIFNVTSLVTHTTLNIFTYAPPVNTETEILIMSRYTKDR